MHLSLRERTKYESLQRVLGDQIEKTKSALDEASALKAELAEHAAIRETLAGEMQRADAANQEAAAANERLEKEITGLQSALEENGKKTDTMQEDNKELLLDLDSKQSTEKEMNEKLESLESQLGLGCRGGR